MYKIEIFNLKIFLQKKIRYKSMKWNSKKLKRKISKTIDQNFMLMFMFQKCKFVYS